MNDPPPTPAPSGTDIDSGDGRPAAASWLPVSLKRIGLAGFLFFLIKGLLWLALPTLLVVFGGRC